MTPQTVPGSGCEIRVLLVDDSPLAVEIIRRMLATTPDIRVVGTAGNGVEALDLIPQVRPDVICTDLHMPYMDGCELTQEVMARNPLPILVFSVSVQAEQEHNIFRVLEAGAIDIAAKPRGGLDSGFAATAREIVEKIRVLSGVKVFGRHRAKADAAAEPFLPLLPRPMGRVPRIIGIGASTGGPQALETILRHLPQNFALPLVCVQHIAEGFMRGLVDWLAGSCRIRVCIAEDGAAPRPGTAYFAPDARHIEIDAAGKFRCSATLAFGGHRPSVDIAFNSLVRCYGADAIGVLLTGMGQDGAQGLLNIARAGGITLAQDAQSSVVFGMPKRAIELGAAKHVLPLARIGPALCELATANAPRANVAGAAGVERS